MFTHDDIAAVFRPSAPIDDIAHFVGRKDQVDALTRCIRAHGRHAIVFGPRGIGKSSLNHIVESALPTGYIAVTYTCSWNSQYTELGGKLLSSFGCTEYESETKLTYARKLNAGVKTPFAGGGVNTNRQEEVTSKPILTTSPTPDFVASKIDRPSILFVDEFDTLQVEETRQYVSALMKALADYNKPTTIVLIGVADRSSDLIELHPSITRNITSIAIPVMSKCELKQILHNGFLTLKLQCDAQLINQIAELSNGLPYFPHLLGEVLSYYALEQQKIKLCLADLKPVLGIALNTILETVHDTFELATSAEFCPYDSTLFPRKTMTDPILKRAVLYGLVISRSSDWDAIAASIRQLFDGKAFDYLPLLREHSENTGKSKPASDELDGIDVQNISTEIARNCTMIYGSEETEFTVDPFLSGFVFLKALEEYGSEVVTSAQSAI